MRFGNENIDLIIKETVSRYLKNQLLIESDNAKMLYHCYNGSIQGKNCIWLSDSADNSYGRKTAEFSVPLKEFAIADSDTVIEYIKKYDIPTWKDAMSDEYIDFGLEYFDWKKYRNGKISDEEAYNQIPMKSWTEVMEHPDYYNFPQALKNDGYDGYSFKYIDFAMPTYYIFFDIAKILKYRTI